MKVGEYGSFYIQHVSFFYVERIVHLKKGMVSLLIFFTQCNIQKTRELVYYEIVLGLIYMKQKMGSRL